MVRPEAAHSVGGAVAAVAAPMRTDTLWPRASVICEATVRFQIRS